MSDEPRLGGRQPQAIRSAFAVLRAVAQAGPGVTAKEISAQLRMPSATTYRLLNILVGEEYVVRLPDLSGFALGARVGELIPAPYPTDVESAVDDLRQTTGEAVTFASYDEGRIRFVSPDPRTPPSRELLVASNLHASAIGKVLLASFPDWRAVLSQPRLPQLAGRTITDPDRLDHELTAIRADAVAVQSDELHDGSVCVAVPVMTGGAVRGALAVSGDSRLLPGVERICTHLRRTAHQIGPRLLPSGPLTPAPKTTWRQYP